MKKNAFIRKSGRALLLCAAGMLITAQAYGQALTIKGVVKDKAGEPVIGANVLVKGTTNGTITDFDGNFVLNADKNDIIAISFIGYQTQELPASALMNVVLSDDSQLLQDVVIIGYGTVKKDDLTGSVATVKADQINKGVATSPSDLLRGKSAGVVITQGSGQPGAARLSR